MIKLWNYQEEAVEFIAKAKKVYLALDMGMGKTLTALSAADRLGKKNVLVVAEKNEIVNSENFRKEVLTHFPNFQYISLREEDLSFLAGSNTRTVCGINPDALKKYSVEEIKRLFDFIIMDEATFAKTTTTQRFKAVKKICVAMEYVVLMSGTPMMNGAAELFAPLVLLGHQLAGDGTKKASMAFDTIFAGGHHRKLRSTGKFYLDYMWWNKGANHVRELRFLVDDAFFFKLKSESNVFKKKIRKIIAVPMTPKWEQEYTDAWEAYLVEAAQRSVDMGNVLELQRLIENGQTYQVNSKWKALRVVKDIADGVYGKQRIIIFSSFIETDLLIQTRLLAEKISFKTFDDVNEWKKGDEQVLVGRIKSHGKGGNVPEASVVLFVDMDFVPSNNLQAENRVDRPEQKNEMTIVYYLAESETRDIVDEHVRKINQDKRAKIEKFMQHLTDEEMETMPNLTTALIEANRQDFRLLGIDI